MSTVAAILALTPAKADELPPFLEVFKGRAEPAVAADSVVFTSATGPVRGYLARPDTKEALPAVLLIHGETGLNDWMKTTARELCGVGYVVLAPDLQPQRPQLPGRQEEERALAELSAAVRWLRRRADVLPDRVGVAGWGRGGSQALVLAACTPLQACVLCDGEVTDDPALVAGLRGTPVLALFGGEDNKSLQALPAFRKAIGSAKVRVYQGLRKGFMMRPHQTGAAHDATEAAWVEVYEFLGRHVEDAPEKALSGTPGAKGLATVADIMGAVNQPTGVRGTLMKLLDQEPTTPRQWRQVKANAALMAEAGRLLQGHTPAKGSAGDWLEQAKGYTASAEQVATAAERADYAAAQVGLKGLAASCAACHKRHR